MSPDEDLSSMTKAELEEIAAKRGFEVTSSMTKQEMLDVMGHLSPAFVTPRVTRTSIPGRKNLSDKEKARIASQAGGVADQSSLGGTAEGGTAVDEVPST